MRLSQTTQTPAGIEGEAESKLETSLVFSEFQASQDYIKRSCLKKQHTYRIKTNKKRIERNTPLQPERFMPTPAQSQQGCSIEAKDKENASKVLYLRVNRLGLERWLSS